MDGKVAPDGAGLGVGGVGLACGKGVKGVKGVKGAKGMQVWILVSCSRVIRDVILTEHDTSSLDGVKTLPDLQVHV